MQSNQNNNRSLADKTLLDDHYGSRSLNEVKADYHSRPGWSVAEAWDDLVTVTIDLFLAYPPPYLYPYKGCREGG